MGRRSLPKIDPTVSLAQHLTVLEELEPPLNPQSLFPSPQPLELEVGSGKGHFLLTHSQQFPERNFVGIELAKKYAQFAAYRLAKRDTPNAHVISGDGLRFFREFVPDDCADDVHVYFPDPWWKERHRRRRVMQPEFIADIQRVLKRDGTFHFWTDVEQYFEETIELMKLHSDLTGPLDVDPTVPEHDMDYRTHFERRMRKGGHDVFRAQFNKP